MLPDPSSRRNQTSVSKRVLEFWTSVQTFPGSLKPMVSAATALVEDDDCTTFLVYRHSPPSNPDCLIQEFLGSRRIHGGADISARCPTMLRTRLVNRSLIVSSSSLAAWCRRERGRPPCEERRTARPGRSDPGSTDIEVPVEAGRVQGSRQRGEEAVPHGLRAIIPPAGTLLGPIL